jgi:hypothetical protein
MLVIVVLLGVVGQFTVRDVVPALVAESVSVVTA